MPKYIEADKINIDYEKGEYYYHAKVTDIPLIEGAPIHYAQWRQSGAKYKSCSRCGQFIETKALHNEFWKYCPFCGAIII